MARQGICVRLLASTIAILLLPVWAFAQSSSSDLRYTKDGKLVFPENYREWIWLSSGLGMSYTPSQGNENPSFDNVFVSPAAYRSFNTTGTWPDGTVFILEVRSSVSKGSINQAGHYQGELADIEAHVKDSGLKGKWGFFGFGSGRKPAAEIPRTAGCYSCHERSGAVDTTFVQFYPTLFKVAQEKKTLSTTWTNEH